MKKECQSTIHLAPKSKLLLFWEAFIYGTWSDSLVPRPRAPPGERRSGERSRISWAYYPKRVMTNEIARSVIIT